MVFMCQNDSFLKTLSTQVVSCEPATFTAKDNPQPVAGFNVILADTVLFPEGGGQPSDRGLMNGQPVLNVVRHYADAIHFVHTADAFVPGQNVDLVVDWPLRFDQMQQHSGQHLITAIFEQHYKFDTSTWYMGAETSFVQLDTPSLSAELLAEAEDRINAIIAEGCDVTVQTVNPATAATDPNALDVTRATRGLPKDHAVRIVTFAGIESNMCCGTHVRNLSQLQVIRLLHTEPGKGTGTTLLHFAVGDRVRRYARLAYARERRLNTLLGCEPAVHVEMLQKTQEKLRAAQRSIKRLHKEMAAFEARAVDAAEGAFYCLHRKDGQQESGYLQAVMAAVRRKEVFVFGTTGDEQVSNNNGNGTAAGGKLMLQGRAVDVDALAPVLCELLDGKGAGKNGRFQAKVNNLRRLKECDARVADYFAQLSVRDDAAASN